MSMHLCGPELTTTSTKKREVKVTKAQQEEIERGWRERNARLKQMGLPKESLEQYTDWLYGRGKKTKDKSKTAGPVTKTAFVKERKSDTRPSQDSPFKLSPGPRENSQQPIRSLNEWVTGPVSSKPVQVYTGTKVIGIGTMHKSNMVPIFSDNEAEEISKMRRG
jgi:hypothetical protein